MWMCPAWSKVQHSTYFRIISRIWWGHGFSRTSLPPRNTYVPSTIPLITIQFLLGAKKEFLLGAKKEKPQCYVQGKGRTQRQQRLLGAYFISRMRKLEIHIWQDTRAPSFGLTPNSAGISRITDVDANANAPSLDGHLDLDVSNTSKFGLITQQNLAQQNGSHPFRPFFLFGKLCCSSSNRSLSLCVVYSQLLSIHIPLTWPIVVLRTFAVLRLRQDIRIR